MKLTSFQLESQLVKSLAPVYIVSGEELLLKQDTITLIRKAAKKAGFSERTRFIAEPGSDWEELYTLLYSTSLFAEKRLIELDFRGAAPPKSAGILLHEYANNPSPNHLIMIDVGKIDDKIAKSTWYGPLEKAGVVINIWPLPREQFPLWIINRAKKFKLIIPREAANLLSDYTEGNLVAAAQAIEKIYLLKPSQLIDIDLINAVLTDASRFTIFDFLENLIAGNKSRTLHILDNLRLEGTEPILILWGITRELRLLADLAQQLKNSLTYETLFQKNRIFARRQASIRHFLAKTSTSDCWHHLARAGDIDKIIKGAMPGSAWEALNIFCLRLL